MIGPQKENVRAIDAQRDFDSMSPPAERNDGQEGDSRDGRGIREPVISTVPPDGGTHGDPNKRPLRERLRVRTGLTPRQWVIAISVLLFIPYPVFVYAIVYTGIDLTLVGIVSLVYSLGAIILHFSL